MDINKINSTTYLQKNFDEFENLDFWQLKKILELIDKAKNMPKEDNLEEISDLQDQINELEDKLEDAEYEYSRLEDKFNDLKDERNELKQQNERLQSIVSDTVFKRVKKELDDKYDE